MGCCSAVKCNNRTENGFKMYRFPTDPHRKKIWVHNMRRGRWIPTSSSRLCERHFESSQFERHRADRQIKLKPNAVPTLFDITKPSLTIKHLPRKSIYKSSDNNLDLGMENWTHEETKNGVDNGNKVDDEITKLRLNNSELKKNLAAEQEKVQKLMHEKKQLEQQLKAMNEIKRSFPTEDQIKLLKGRVSQYGKETIIIYVDV